MARTIGSHARTTGPRIRTAARKLFARHGYAAVTMRQIAAKVGVQVGALYLYIPDKQSLLFDLMKADMAALLAAWAAAPHFDDPTDQLEAFCRFHVRYHLDHSDAAFVAAMELRNLSPENFLAIEALRKQYEDSLQAILVAGDTSDDFKIPDTKLATMALLALLTGVTSWYREGGRLSRRRVERIYWNMVRRAVGA